MSDLFKPMLRMIHLCTKNSAENSQSAKMLEPAPEDKEEHSRMTSRTSGFGCFIFWPASQGAGQPNVYGDLGFSRPRLKYRLWTSGLRVLMFDVTLRSCHEGMLRLIVIAIYPYIAASLNKVVPTGNMNDQYHFSDHLSFWHLRL